MTTHGGPRPGAGRPLGSRDPSAAHRKRRMVLLSDEEYAQAKALGDGNLSAGLRVALDLARLQTPSHPSCP